MGQGAAPRVPARERLAWDGAALLRALAGELQSAPLAAAA